MELTVLRQRSQEAMKQMAARGELFTSVAVGYVTTDNRLEKDLDARVQNAIGLVFQKFRELGTVRQVLLRFREEQVPCRRSITGAADVGGWRPHQAGDSQKQDRQPPLEDQRRDRTRHP